METRKPIDFEDEIKKRCDRCHEIKIIKEITGIYRGYDYLCIVCENAERIAKGMPE